MLLEGKLWVTKQDKTSKYSFFLMDLTFQGYLGLEISYQKGQKSVMYFFNVPLAYCDKFLTAIEVFQIV
jgi:hypothetical protein